ncbi:MAG TPA: transglycosylase domain-containing protein [Baekduia sp.]|nr:transglycosylase domain-containing protein [Baekduia sp.]
MTRRHRTKRRRHQEGGRASKVVFLTLGVLLAAAGIGALALVGYIISIANSAPDINTLKPVDKGAVSSVYAANGSRLGFIGSDELRTPIEGRQIPKIIKQATVAIEDRRYYQHGGVDYPGIVRAGIDNLRAGKTVQGGSTITMQLVRNLAYVSTERTYQRKIKEAKLADELESERSKSWILDTYLNSVPYGTVAGRSAIGIEAASRMFFDKPARKLKLREAALLAGLPQAPSAFNPFTNPDAARTRRNEVLTNMEKQRMITMAEGERLKDSKLGVKPNDYYTRKKENYFFDYVQQELIDRYGANTVRRGGLKVYTTIDLDLQREARAAMFGRLGEPTDPRSAIVSVDPSNGYIRAMASSADYRKNKYNLAAQGKRQPGSTFKVMVLMTALRKGIDPQSTTYVSKPLSINDPRYGPWNVKTYSGGYAGPLNLVQATLQSDNTVYAQLDLDVGPDAVKETARMMGITSKLNGYPAEGLGGLEDGVSPLEMASAYATIANGGWRIRPTAIHKVVFPDGKVTNLGKVRRKKVFTDGVTAEATNILEQNVQKGTGTAANIGCPAAGKTGTTDNYTDAWFVGFTPKLATATWVGYPQSTQIRMDNVKGVTVAGGTYPAEIWGDYMRMVKGGFCGDFSAPQTSFNGSPGNQAKPSDEQSGGQNGGGGGGGNGGYDPGLYDTPPQ